MAVVRPVVMCGPSGTGKSTLLKKLMEEYKDCFAFSVSRKSVRQSISQLLTHSANKSVIDHSVNKSFIDHSSTKSFIDLAISQQIN